MITGCRELQPNAMTIPDQQLVNAKRLLEVLFEEKSRPSLRWLREQQARRTIPYVKIGRLCFFDPVIVREHLNARSTIKPKRP